MASLVFSRKIASQRDMGELEDTLSSLLGGEQHKCAFVRSQDFVRLRLLALYKAPPPRLLVVYGEGLKITLDSDKVASVFLLNPMLDPEPRLAGGKRAEPDDDDSFGQ